MGYRYLGNGCYGVFAIQLSNASIQLLLQKESVSFHPSTRSQVPLEGLEGELGRKSIVL